MDPLPTIYLFSESDHGRRLALAQMAVVASYVPHSKDQTLGPCYRRFLQSAFARHTFETGEHLQNKQNMGASAFYYSLYWKSLHVFVCQKHYLFRTRLLKSPVRCWGMKYQDLEGGGGGFDRAETYSNVEGLEAPD